MTSSNEQYRIIKQIDGKNGATLQDSIDESIDNGLDADANLIELIFVQDNDGTYKIRSIYNNGRPMNKNDRTNFLTLDSCGKLYHNGEPLKGKYGIGSFVCRGRLAGQGTETTTSYNGEATYQVTINMEKLTDKTVSPVNCWTNQDSKYRPSWKKTVNTSPHLESNYREGVTKEFIGANLKQKFNIPNVILHICKKYNRNIKNNISINVIVITKQDRKIYNIPDIYNDSVGYTETIN